MRLRDYVVQHDVDHGAGCEGECVGQDRLGDTHRQRTQNPEHGLHQAAKLPEPEQARKARVHSNSGRAFHLCDSLVGNNQHGTGMDPFPSQTQSLLIRTVVFHVYKVIHPNINVNKPNNIWQAQSPFTLFTLMLKLN